MAALMYLKTSKTTLLSHNLCIFLITILIILYILFCLIYFILYIFSRRINKLSKGEEMQKSEFD